eukprot:2085823-Pyramimonas_sp.AAC.1
MVCAQNRRRGSVRPARRGGNSRLEPLADVHNTRSTKPNARRIIVIALAQVRPVRAGLGLVGLGWMSSRRRATRPSADGR